MHQQIIFCLIFLTVACQNPADKPLINTTHLDNLYKEIVLDGDTLAFVYIYAEYPDYNPIEAVGEGISCADDVARAAVFYFRLYEQTKDIGYLKKAKKLINFILYMQADNGLFYNFINADFSINKTHKNSLASAGWWTWRALWALSEAMPYAKKSEPQYYKKIVSIFNENIDVLNREKDVNAILDSLAADQASVLLMALTGYSKVTADTLYLDYITLLAHNIMSKQKGSETSFPYFAFMSWQNIWHGWGNTQAYALLKAAQITGDQEMVNAAANEVRYFYPYIISKSYLKQFILTDNEQDSEFENFEQIAYALRPMVWASLELYKMRGDEIFVRQAGQLASWLAGENIIQLPLYDPQTGRCFDGINSIDTMNKNSGAESTIEALLTLIEVEQYPVANSYLKAAYRKYAQ